MGLNIGMLSYVKSLQPANHSIKYVVDVVQVWSGDEWVSHHLSSWPIRVYMKLWILPCSPMDLVTCST